MYNNNNITMVYFKNLYTVKISGDQYILLYTPTPPLSYYYRFEWPSNTVF